MIRSQSVEAGMDHGRTQSAGVFESILASSPPLRSSQARGGEDAGYEDRALYATAPSRTPPLCIVSPQEVRRKADAKVKDTGLVSPRTQLIKMKNKVREKSVRVSPSPVQDPIIPRMFHRERDDRHDDEFDGWTLSDVDGRLDLCSELAEEQPEEEKSYGRIDRLRDYFLDRGSSDDRDENGRDYLRWLRGERSSDNRHGQGGEDRYEREERSERRSLDRGDRGDRQRSRGSFTDRERGEGSSTSSSGQGDRESRTERSEREKRDSESRERARDRERRSTAGASSKNLSPYRYVEEKDRRASMSGDRPRIITRSDERESSRDRSDRDRDRGDSTKEPRERESKEPRERKRRDKGGDRDRSERPRDRDKSNNSERAGGEKSGRLKRAGSSYSVREEKSEETRGGSLIIDRDARTRDRSGSGGRSPKVPSAETAREEDRAQQKRDDREGREGRRGPSLEDRKGWNMLREREERRERDEETRKRRDPYQEIVAKVESLWATDIMPIEEPDRPVSNGRLADVPTNTLMRPLPPLNSATGTINMPKSLLGKFLLIRWTMRPLSTAQREEDHHDPAS